MNQHSILVVDDDQSTRQYLTDFLSSRGYMTLKEKRHVKTEGGVHGGRRGPFATGGARLHAGGHGLIAVSIPTGGAPAQGGTPPNTGPPRGDRPVAPRGPAGPPPPGSDGAAGLGLPAHTWWRDPAIVRAYPKVRAVEMITSPATTRPGRARRQTVLCHSRSGRRPPRRRSPGEARCRWWRA